MKKIDIRNEKHDSPKISKVDRLSEKVKSADKGIYLTI